MSEIADFLEIFVPKEVKIKVPKSVQCKSVALLVETMKEIISDLGLEISGTKKSSAIRTIDRNIRVTELFSFLLYPMSLSRLVQKMLNMVFNQISRQYHLLVSE